MNSIKINLGSVQQTLLLPLWGRAVETQKEHPLLMDATALRIVNDLDFDFSTIAANTDPLTQAAWIARSIYFDQEIREFLARYPEGSILNVGCGFDTTYDRISHGQGRWYEIDLPDVIALRRKYIPESEDRRFIAASVFEPAWYESILQKDRVLTLLAGVIYYFDEDQVKQLLSEFSRRFKVTDVIFDYCSKQGLEITNQKVLVKGGMSKDAFLRWSIEDIYELEKWEARIKIRQTMPMFEEHKKKYPVEKQVGMNMADRVKIMSLAHITIGDASGEG